MVCTGHGGQLFSSQHAHSNRNEILYIPRKALPGAHVQLHNPSALPLKRIMETLPCSNPPSISQPPPSSAFGPFTSPLIGVTSRWDLGCYRSRPCSAHILVSECPCHRRICRIPHCRMRSPTSDSCMTSFTHFWAGQTQQPAWHHM